jgi:hypothetical protein
MTTWNTQPSSSGVITSVTVSGISTCLFADLPAAGIVGRLIYVTDTPAIYVDNGTTWIHASTPVGLTAYATGSWTPTVGGTATENNSGQYTKIGNVVTVTCVLSITTIGTGSTASISGLPYPIKTGTPFIAPCYWDSLTTPVVALIVRGLSSTANLWSALAADDNLTLRAVLGDNSSIFFSGSYLTD